MIRLTAMYPAKDGEAFDDAYYYDKHHKLCVSLLTPEGMVSCEFDKGLSDPAGGKPAFVAIANLTFKSLADMQSALAKHGAAVMGDVPNYTKINPILQVSEVTAR